ncbi:protein CIP2A [Ditylenchus destructor]|nr:protein CIP2A [Ditylenchus destructor]
MIAGECNGNHSTPIEILLQQAQSAAQLFLLNDSESNGQRLNDTLSILISESAVPTKAGFLKLDHGSTLGDFLLTAKQLLMVSSTSVLTRSRLRLVLFNISLFNVSVRRYCAGELELCGPVFHCLEISLKEQLGPQNIIDSLRLLQVLTYERSLALGSSWINALISFLVEEILLENEPEWLPYCCAILSNLASRSKTLCNKLKKQSTYKKLCKRLLDLLQHDSKMVVLCSLVLIGYLDERTRDVVFSSKNMSQAFICIFNVLGSGDQALMTVHIAVDLLCRLVISSPSSSRLAAPSLAATAKDFPTYGFFAKSMQKVAALLQSFDARVNEESMKIYDLLLSFCKLHELRSPVSLAIAEKSKLNDYLTTPILTICHAAFLRLDESLFPDISLSAIRLLIFILQETIDNGVRVQELLSAGKICQLVESNIKTSLETKSDLISLQCAKITEGLRLAEVVANDEEVRVELLDVVNASLCSHINESQFVSNPIVNFFTGLDMGISSSLPDWSIHGVGILLASLRLLATLKDYSRTHKELYWRNLKDDRIIPFIAIAFTSHDSQTIFDALFLFTHTVQVQEFPVKRLADLIARVSQAMSRISSASSSSENLQNGHRLSLESSVDLAQLSEIPASECEAFQQVDELLEQMKKGVNLKDVRMSQLVQAFERKIFLHKNRERELEKLISVKEQAISQCERLRLATRDRGNASEVTNLRLLLNDLEKKLSERDEEFVVIRREKMELTELLRKLQHDMEHEREQSNAKFQDLEREKSDLIVENGKERDLHAALRTRFDEITRKFDMATKAVFEKQMEIETMSKTIAEQQRATSELRTELDRKNKECAGARSEIASKVLQMDEQRKKLEKLEEENQVFSRIKALCGAGNGLPST